MALVGGLRARLLHDSLRSHLVSALNVLGWMDPGRSHKPITFLSKPVHWSVPVEPNIIALEFDSDTTDEIEVGSALTTTTSVAYVNVFAENDAFGVDISNDIRDILRGRLVVTRTSFPIYDYQTATPPVLGYAGIADATVLRSEPVTTDYWLQHWFLVRCEIEDTYYNTEEGGAGVLGAPVFPGDVYPGGNLFPAESF